MAVPAADSTDNFELRTNLSSLACVKISATYMNFKSKKWTVLLLIFLIVLAVSIFIQFSLGLSGTFSKSPFHKQSEVSVSLANSKLKLDFETIEDDRLTFQNFIENWFGTKEEIKSLDFGIDENLLQILSPILPTKLSFNVKDKILEFKSHAIPGLQTALTGTDINFATGSGKLRVKYSNPTQYQLGIENPEDLIFYATASGMLTTSSKIEGLFKSLPKVATIELEVSGKNIAGKIVLK